MTQVRWFEFIYLSGGSRISQKGGAPTPEFWAKNLLFDKIFAENCKGGVPSAIAYCETFWNTEVDKCITLPVNELLSICNILKEINTLVVVHFSNIFM